MLEVRDGKNHHYDYLKMYQDLGYATFELNSFKSRNIESTVGKQNQVTVAAMVFDAYKALEKLIKTPFNNKDKISITGWSLGGGVTLFSAWKPIIKSFRTICKLCISFSFLPTMFF